MIITNPPRERTFGHNIVQPDWPNLTLPYLANYFEKPEVIDNSQSLNYPKMKGDIAISIRSEREYPKGLEMIKLFGIKIAGGPSAMAHKEELYSMGVHVNRIEEDKLDDTPIPRWDLAPKLKSKYFKGRNTGSIEMSRGCPHSCDFCATTAYWKEFKHKSNDRILEELKYLKEIDRTHIYLTDDNFGVNIPKHTALLEKLVDLDMRFFTQIRADTIAKNPEMIKLAKRAGFYGFLIGFDTYDSDVMSGENKKTSIETNIKASQICRENDIAIYGCHIYGLPSQKNPKDFEKTFEMGRKYSDLFVMSFFHALPGTKSADKAPVRGEEWQKEYGNYYGRHQFSLREAVLTLTHKNPIVRNFKRGGYKKYFSYKLR